MTLEKDFVLLHFRKTKFTYNASKMTVAERY